MSLTEEHIRGLCQWPHRGSTTVYEGLAAEYARSKLEEMDYRVVAEKFKAPASALYPTYMLMSAWAAMACILAFKWPIPAVFVSLLPFLYLFAEFYMRWPIHNLLFPGGSSQNVIAYVPKENAKAKVILSAHLDTQVGSYLFSKRWVRFQPLLTNAGMIGIVMAVVLSALRVFGLGGMLLAALLLSVIIMMLFISLLYARAEWTGAYVQGANDDASGTSIILALAEDLHKVSPQNLEVWIVATGAEETGLCGMAHFMRKGRGRDFDKESAYFINFDNLGSGDMVYLTGESIPGFQYPGPLVGLAKNVNEDDHSPDAQPGWWGVPTDALIPALRGYPAVTIFGYDKDGLSPNYHYRSDTVENVDFDLPEKARAFALDLIRKLDNFVAEKNPKDDINT